MPKVKRSRYELDNLINDTNKRIMNNIEILCRKRKISVRQMASDVGIKPSTWTNRIKDPTSFKVPEVIAIAYYLKISLGALLFGKIEIKCNEDHSFDLSENLNYESS